MTELRKLQRMTEFRKLQRMTESGNLKENWTKESCEEMTELRNS